MFSTGVSRLSLLWWFWSTNRVGHFHMECVCVWAPHTKFFTTSKCFFLQFGYRESVDRCWAGRHIWTFKNCHLCLALDEWVRLKCFAISFSKSKKKRHRAFPEAHTNLRMNMQNGMCSKTSFAAKQESDLGSFLTAVSSCTFQPYSHSGPLAKKKKKPDTELSEIRVYHALVIQNTTRELKYCDRVSNKSACPFISGPQPSVIWKIKRSRSHLYVPIHQSDQFNMTHANLAHIYFKGNIK